MRLRGKILGVVVVALIAIGGAVATGPAGQTASAATTLTVNVGGGGGGVAANGFFPQAVTIATGTTIHFVNPYAEPHTVTFLPGNPATLPDLLVPDPGGSPAQGFNPIFATASPASPATFDATKPIESGILNKDGTYDISFPATGSFVFRCAFHPNMQLTVKVASSGTVDTQTTVDARAKTELDATLAAGNAEATTLAAAPVTSTKNADGTTTWQVNVGGGATVPNSPDLADVMQFFPANVSIKQGDTVTWTNNVPTPHTVSFLSGAAVPGLISPIPQTSGPPFLAISPQVALAAGGNTYDGTGVVSSGLFGTGLPNPKSFSVKFTKAGTFTYVCILHADQGMAGGVTVAAASAPATAPTAPTGVTAPNTGTGPMQQNGGGTLLYALGALGLLCGAALIVAGRRVCAREVRR